MTISPRLTTVFAGLYVRLPTLPTVRATMAALAKAANAKTRRASEQCMKKDSKSWNDDLINYIVFF